MAVTRGENRIGVTGGPGLLFRFRAPVLILFAAVTALLCAGIGELKQAEHPLAALYPEGHPYLPALRAIRRMSATPRMLVVLVQVKDGDIYNRATLEKIDRVTKRLMRIRGVLPGGIVSLTRGIPHYENTAEGLVTESILGKRWPETPAEFEALRRRVAVNPRGAGRYVSYDGTTAMITAPLVDAEAEVETAYRRLPPERRAGLSLEAYRRRVEQDLQQSLLEGVRAVQAAEADPDHVLLFMGPQLLEAQMTAIGGRQVPLAAGASCLLAALLLWVWIGTWRGALLSLLVMVLCLAWTFGLLGLLGISVNPLPLAFPLLLGLFSLAWGGLLVERYGRAFPRTRDRLQAVRSAYGRSPVPASMATLAVVFGSLPFSGIPVFRALGGMGLCWVVGTSAVLGILLPLLLPLCGGGGGLRARRASRTGPASVAPGRREDGGGGRWVPASVLLVLLLVGGGLAGRTLRVGDNLPGPSYIPTDHPWNRCFHLLADKFMGPYQFLVYAKAKEPGGLTDPEAVGEIGDFRRYLKFHGGARDVIAFDVMVTEARGMLMDGNPKWLTIPLGRDQVRRMGELALEQGEVGGFIDPTFTEATISPFFPRGEAERIEDYAALMQAYIDAHREGRVDFRLGGGLLGMTKVIDDGVRLAYPQGLALAFLVVFLCAAAATRSPARGLAVVLPIAAAQGGLWLLMAAAGARLSVPVVLVSAVGVGFCSTFGYCGTLGARDLAGSRGGGAGRGAGSGTWRDGLLPGALVFAGALPWAFLGLRFPARMALAAGGMVLLGALCSALFGPGLEGLWTGWRPAGETVREGTA